MIAQKVNQNYGIIKEDELKFIQNEWQKHKAMSDGKHKAYFNQGTYSFIDDATLHITYN